MPRALRTTLLSLASFLLTAVPVLAQGGGTVSGRVTEAEGGRPIANARVQILLPNGAPVASGTSRTDGSYRILNVAPGSYTVKISYIGFAPREFPGTAVSGGGTATVDATLATQATQLAELEVIGVSRTPEKVLDAPASVGVVTQTEIEERPALTVADHLKGLPGVDISQGGLVQSNVVGRGFNNIFSGALLTLTDYRYAAVPSLRVNVAAFFPITNDDVERVEFVLGPGAALYGPNAANGVLNILTKSAFTTGTTVSFEGGARAGSEYLSGGSTLTDGGSSLWRGSFRHAMTLGSKAAIKVSGDYLKSTDWRFRDAAEPATLPNQPGVSCNPQTGCRDFDLEKWGGEARLDIRPDENTEVVASYGRSTAENLIEFTGIGAAQARGWTYQHVQTRFRVNRFFVQGFVNFSDAGETFLLRDGNPIVDKSKLWAAQFQYGFDLGARQTFLFGADLIYTNAVTDSTINGSNEDDDNIREIGGYLHSVTRLSPKWDVVSALRLDNHSRLESAVVSPRLALVFKPTETQNLRVTYNRAFSTPSNNNLFLDIPAGTIPLGPGLSYTVRALGVPKDGFHFRTGGCGAGGVDGLCMRSPFLPPAAGALPAHAALLWAAAAAAVPDPGLRSLMVNNPPTPAQVGTQLRTLDPTARVWDDAVPGDVGDIERLEPTITNGFEAGYKAILANKVSLSVDGWYEKKKNFVGPLIVESPTVFLDRPSTIAYLTTLFTNAGVPNPAATAMAVGTGIAGLDRGTQAAGTTGVPLATVVPTNTSLTERPDIFLTYRNFGEVDLYGADVALDYVINQHFALAGTYSWVSDDFFPRSEVGGDSDVALNASSSKGSVTGKWRNDLSGLAAEVRFRAVKAFPVNSGVYVSQAPVGGYEVFDVQGSWRPPVGARNMLLTANVANLFNKKYATFVGVPNLGRLFITKVSYTF